MEALAQFSCMDYDKFFQDYYVEQQNGLVVKTEF